MIVHLYRLTRRETGQSYIGITIDARKRRNMHWWIAKKKPGQLYQLVHRAIAKHGRDAFDFEVIACSRDYAAALRTEVDLILQWRTHVSVGGYNLTLGGEGPLGRKHSPVTRAKISASRAGQPGRRITDVEKAASRAQLLALNYDQRVTRALRAAEARKKNGTLYGRKNPPETIARMKAAALARWDRERLLTAPPAPSPSAPAV